MYRKLLIPVLVLFMVSTACLFSGKATPTAVPTAPAVAAPTDLPVVEAPTSTIEVPTEVVAPTEVMEATLPPEPPTEAPPAKPTATEAPAGPQPFTEEFDNTALPGWKYLYVAGTERANKIFVEDSRLKFTITTPETYAYVYNTETSYTDVIVSAEVENLGDNDNAMVLTCRMSERGWYELRVTSSSSVFLYRYDQIKKDKHEVPYVSLVPQTVTRVINPGFKTNKIALSCIGDEIRMYVNGTELIYQNQPVVDSKYKEGYVGVGGMTFTTTKYPVKIEYEQVTTQLP